MRALLSQGADLDEPDSVQRKVMSPLIQAARTGRTQVVEFLASCGADLNGCDFQGWTPLMHAADGGHEDAMSVLIEQGAGLNFQSTMPQEGCEGGTALMIAAKQGHTDCVQVLVDAGADQQIRDRNGWTAWSKAVFEGYDNQLAALMQPSRRANERLRERQQRDSPDSIARYMIEHHGV